MKYHIMILAALFGLHAATAAAQQEDYACEAKYNGDDLIKDVLHSMTVGTSGGAVTRFEFLSFTPPGATLCAYIADSRAKADDDAAKALLPVWSQTAGGARITIPSSRGDSAVISLEDKGTYFRFEIVETGATEEFCNLYGIAAPVVKLYKNKKTCGFPKQ